MAAPKTGALGSLKSAAAGLASRLPFLRKRPETSPEPFSAIADSTPFGDLLSSANVAPDLASKAEGREKPDFRALIGTVAKSPILLAGIIIGVAFGLALAITSIVIASPPKPPAAFVPFTEKGQALVKTWLPPPGDPLEPRMIMEREGAGAYTSQDAAKLGIHPDPAVMAKLRDKNDKAIEDLYGTVP